MNRIKIAAALVVMLMVFSSAPCMYSVAGDWTDMSGSDETPWITDAFSPTTFYTLDQLWVDEGTVGGGGMTFYSPSTPLSVGQYTYYVDVNDQGAVLLTKRLTSDGSISATQQIAGVALPYNFPIAYGEVSGKGIIFMQHFTGSIELEVKAYASDNLSLLGTSSCDLYGAQGMLSALTFHEGKLYVKTYGEKYNASTGQYEGQGSVAYDLVCLGVQYSAGTVTFTQSWGLRMGGWSYADTVDFYEMGGTEYVVLANKGFTKSGGSSYDGVSLGLYNTDTGALQGTVKKISGKYCLGGVTVYNGRAYVSCVDTQDYKTMKSYVYSYSITSSGFSDEKVWNNEKGGTQAAPVIYNDRIYLGGGGSTGSPQGDISVIQIGSDSSMSTAYTIPVKTKSTLTLTTAYATSDNGNVVYLYCMPYSGTSCMKQNIQTGAVSATADAPDLCIIRDKAGQTTAQYMLYELFNLDNYSFNAVSITDDGYLLVKNDRALVCIKQSANRIGDANGDGTVDALDVIRTARYLASLESSVQPGGDSNMDGTVDALDVIDIARSLANLKPFAGSPTFTYYDTTSDY